MKSLDCLVKKVGFNEDISTGEMMFNSYVIELSLTQITWEFYFLIRFSLNYFVDERLRRLIRQKQEVSNKKVCHGTRTQIFTSSSWL